MESQPRQSTLRWTYQEMRQKPAPRDTFFSMRSEAADHRPISVATEFVDTDWDEEIFSDMEAEDNSPRVSLQSSGQPSITTLSSYEEAITPRSSQDVGIPTSTSASSRKQQIEGPRGPHLFRNSAEQVSADGDITLTLSPITPKTPAGYPDLWYYYDQQQQGRQQQQQQPRGHASSSPPPPVPALPNQSQQSLASASSHSPGPVGPSPRGSPLQFSTAELDVTQLVMWTPEMVAQSMHDAGLEAQVAARFVENDINGPILTTLKFEDLRELGISSFGIRIRVWNQIQFLLDGHAASPRAPTPIEEAPSREVRSEARRNNHSHSHSASSGAGSAGRRSRNNSHSNRSPGGSPSSSQEAIHPGESVSIIGIEQVIPKPHSCSKGSKCSKWRKQARLLEQFRRMNPDVDISSAAGTVLIAGDAGNPETARAINPDEPFRPMSDAEPSVVASSDILGPGGMPPLQYLQETNLRSIQNRDPQDNVIRFLQFQDQGVNEFPPTPPFEPPQQQQQQQHQQALRRLPRLAIPGTNTSQAAPAPGLPRASTMPVRQQQQQPQQQPRRRQSYMMAKADARSPELNTPPSATAKKQPSPDRYGTPFSEMDVPVTAVPVGPISRDASQSVPPNMNYYNQDLAPSRAASTTPGPPPRAPSRTASRLARAPVMPPVEEQPQTVTSPTLPQATHQLLSQPQRAPPRAVYPWSPVERGNTFETAIPPMALGDGDDAASSSSSTATLNANGGVTHQGPMKRRKAKLLRHEWEDGYFTLRGTRLNMHKDKSHADRTLEYVDIDDYAIACSSLASSSKLSAAFKVMRSAHGRDRAAQDPVGAFQFQLIPQDKTAQGATARLRKRESSFAAPTAAGAGAEGVNGTGKTHHFAVKSRDDRIDWMRELMLAKALKQKGDGFEVSVNGNMI